MVCSSPRFLHFFLIVAEMLLIQIKKYYFENIAMDAHEPVPGMTSVLMSCREVLGFSPFHS